MLKRSGNSWELFPLKVHYKQYGENLESWALPSKEWWENFSNQWEHTSITRFEEITLSDCQIERFEEIKSMPEDFPDVYGEYILYGTVSEEHIFLPNHPFNTIILNQKNKELQIKMQTTQDAIDFLLMNQM